MKFFRRSLIALGVAATLPTIVFGAVGAFYFLRAERSEIETETLALILSPWLPDPEVQIGDPPHTMAGY